MQQVHGAADASVPASLQTRYRKREILFVSGAALR